MISKQLDRPPHPPAPQKCAGGAATDDGADCQAAGRHPARIVLIGPTGAGKTTVSELLGAQLNLPVVG